METKLLLKEECNDFVKSRLDKISQTITHLQQSLTSETKSSAGDKHETGRAMVQLEREKAGRQLAEIQNMARALERIDANTTSAVIRLGSVVFTNKINYFIAISAGKITIDREEFYAISTRTPIAQLLLGKRVDDSFAFKGEQHLIKGII